MAGAGGAGAGAPDAAGGAMGGAGGAAAGGGGAGAAGAPAAAPAFHPNRPSPTAPPRLSCVSDPLGAYGELDALFDELILVFRDPVGGESLQPKDSPGGTFDMVKPGGQPASTVRGSREDLEVSVNDWSNGSCTTLKFATEPLCLEAWVEAAGKRLIGEKVAEALTAVLHRLIGRMQERSRLVLPPDALGSSTTLFADAASAAVMFAPSSVSCPWLQFEFSGTTTVTSVQTKRYADEPQWLETFSLSYSNDGEHWAEHGGVFGGNDSGTLDEVQVEPPIAAKLIRIHPMKWHPPGQASLSFEMQCGMLPPPYAHQEAMTIPEAKELCRQRPERFAGFTFEGPPEAEGPRAMMFKERCDGVEEGGGGFTSCLASRGGAEVSSIRAFTVFHGSLAPGNDLAVEDLTLEEAKARCAELEGCCGFCFQGDLRPQGRVRVFFKACPWVLGRGLASGWVACLCGSGAGRAAAVRPPAPPAARQRLGVLDGARPTECATLSHVLAGPLDGVRLRGAFERVVAKNPLLAGRLHRSRPVWKWEVRFDAELGCGFHTRILPPSVHSWLLTLDPKAAAGEYERVRLLHSSLLESGDVELMEQGAAPLCYLTHCVGSRASVVALSLSQKLADEWCVHALFRCLEEEFAEPGSSRPLAGLESIDAATRGVHLAAGPRGGLRMLHVLERHRPAAAPAPLAWLRRLRRAARRASGCPHRAGPPAAAPAPERHLVVVAAAEEALAALRAAAPGAGPSAALAAWIGNAVASPCLRVAVNYRGRLDGLPPDCLGNALGLQDCAPGWGGRFRAAEVEAAVSCPENNFRQAEAGGLPEGPDTVLCLDLEEPRHFPRLGAEVLLSLPPTPWASLDPAGVHRLSRCAPGRHLVTHAVPGERAARGLQAAWLRLGQEASVLRL